MCFSSHIILIIVHYIYLIYLFMVYFFILVFIRCEIKYAYTKYPKIIKYLLKSKTIFFGVKGMMMRYNIIIEYF